MPLPNDLVRAAICEELNYFNKHVWEVAQAKEVMGGMHRAKPSEIASLCVTNWDNTNRDIRARQVAYGAAANNTDVVCCKYD